MDDFIWFVPAGIVLFFLLFPLIEFLASRLVKRRIPPPAKAHRSFGIIVTAYRNWEITVPLVKSLLSQHYPGQYRIYVVADQCEKAAYPIDDERLEVYWPDPALNLKAKSILLATQHFRQDYDHVIIFDADNLVQPDYLHWMNRYAELGYVAVQGMRTAKNLDTFYAKADAAGEFYKNFTDRQIPFLLGASSVISGSGMSVERSGYLEYLRSPEIEQGKHRWKKMLQEDKILQNFLLRRNLRIAYAPEAVVYDEKVDNAEAVETQRSRWLYSYFQNLPNSLGLVRRGIGNFSFNQWWFGLVTVAPPLSIQLLLAGIIFIIGLLVNFWIAILMVIGVFLFILAIPLVLYFGGAPTAVRSVICKLPLFAWRQVRALVKMKDPNKNFKHTENRKMISIEDVERQ